MWIHQFGKPRRVDWILIHGVELRRYTARGMWVPDTSAQRDAVARLRPQR